MPATCADSQEWQKKRTGVDLAGNLTEGLTVFALKDGNVMRRVGIGVGHRSLAAPDAASSINSLYIGPLIRESRYSSWFLREA